jgi:DHA2 family multidrug resistance protein-like MFS transporter
MQHHPDGLPPPRRTWAVAALSLTIFMAVMDSAIANVALPTIAGDLHTNAASSIWIVNGYQLAIAISLLPLSALGEIVGYRRIYLWGLALFTISSLLCAMSASFLMLAGARVLQGFGAAGLMSVNVALVRYTWPHAMLGRGLGVNALVVAVGAAAGPTIAAAILSVASWPWLFAVNVPFGLAAIPMGRYALPHSPKLSHRFDSASALLSAATVGLLIVSVDALGHGELGFWFLAELAMVAALGWILVRRQLHLSAPLVPVDLLKNPLIALSAATSICSFIAQMLAMVALPFLLQSRLGFSAVETGLLITPWPIGTGIAAPISGRLADRYPAGILGAIGLSCLAIGLFALALLSAHPAIADVIWRMALCGIGFGLFQAPNNRAMVGNAPRARAGGAAGMLGTARLLGQTLGAAFVALLFGQMGTGGQVASLYFAGAMSVLAAGVSAIRLMELPGAAQRP